MHVRTPLILALLLAAPVAVAQPGEGSGPVAADPVPAAAEPAPEAGPAERVADPAAAVAAVPGSGTGDGPSLDAIARFAEVYRLVKAAYVQPVSDEALMESAIHGLLSGLDPHSGYLDAQTLEVLTDDTVGAYDGLGVEVLSGQGVIQVMSAMPDSPAARAGLVPGDFITHIDGAAVDRGNLDTFVRKLRGRPGTRIELTVSREGEPGPRQVELVRARIRLSSVTAAVVEPGYGHVHIAQCQQETARELRRRLTQLDRDSGGLRGLVLDLRGNPGGALDAAIAISDLFLAQGRIVSVDGRLPETRQSYDARPGEPWERLPMAVLIDAGTASAAEIIAAALQAHGRAVVLGQRSYGKGSVQNVFALDDSHAVRLTTARYFTADGRSIQAEGVQPDIALGDYALSSGGDSAPMLVESDLPGHLAPLVPVVAAAPDAATSVDDYAVHQAVTVLKGQQVLATRAGTRPAPPERK
jgi:carboxyl-terminal processing protease